MSGLSQIASVAFDLTVLNEDGSVVRKLPTQKNLLLDQGLNKLVSTSWTNLFDYFVIGTGTDPVARDSGTTTFTRAADVVTASASFFEAADVGRILKFDTGEEMYITAFTSSTQVQVNVSGALASSQGTVHYVNRTALKTEVKRTSTKTVDSGDHGFSWNGVTGIYSTWVTRLFSAEAGSVLYTEIGWSESPASGGNVNGMALIAGGGVNLVAGQQLKVKVQLDRTMTPNTPRAVAAWVTGFPGSGEECLESLPISHWDASGNSVDGLLEPRYAGGFRVTTGDVAWRSIPAPPSLLSDAGTYLADAELSLAWDAYVANSFTRVARGTFTSTKCISAAIRNFNYVSPGFAEFAMRIRASVDCAKTSSQTLELVFRKTWGRVLAN